MAKVGEISGATDVTTTPTSGTRILAGARSPVDGDGGVGDYWHDTAGKILYGPKGQSVSATSAASGGIPSNYNVQNDSTLGMRLKFLAPVRVTTLRFFRSGNSSKTSRTLTLYRDGVSVGTATTSGEAGQGWQQATMATPVEVDTVAEYVVAYPSLNSYYVWHSTTPPSPSAPLYVTALKGVSAVGEDFPSTVATNTNFFADLMFVPTWAVALKSAP